MKIKGAIFDLDGTLLDSMSIWNDIGEDYLKACGIKAPKGLYETLKTMSLLQAARFFRNQYELSDSEEKIMEQINNMIAHQYNDCVPLKPHVLSFLKQLKKAGAKMCVATATDCHLAKAALKRLGIVDFFEFIITCTEVGCGKDESVIFYAALDRLKTKMEETIVFEDALHAIKTAKEAGFTVVGVYDASAVVDTNAIKKLADRYINSFDEWEDL